MKNISPADMQALMTERAELVSLLQNPDDPVTGLRAARLLRISHEMAGIQPVTHPAQLTLLRQRLEEKREYLFEPHRSGVGYRYGDGGTLTLVFTNREARDILIHRRPEDASTNPLYVEIESRTDELAEPHETGFGFRFADTGTFSIGLTNSEARSVLSEGSSEFAMPINVDQLFDGVPGYETSATPTPDIIRETIRRCLDRSAVPEEISKDTLRTAAFLIGKLSAIAAGPGAITGLLDFEPNLGATTPEASLRTIIRLYYANHFNPEQVSSLTSGYIDALVNRAPELAAATLHPEMIEDLTGLLINAPELVGHGADAIRKVHKKSETDVFEVWDDFVQRMNEIAAKHLPTLKAISKMNRSGS